MVDETVSLKTNPIILKEYRELDLALIELYKSGKLTYLNLGLTMFVDVSSGCKYKVIVCLVDNVYKYYYIRCNNSPYKSPIPKFVSTNNPVKLDSYFDYRVRVDIYEIYDDCIFMSRDGVFIIFLRENNDDAYNNIVYNYNLNLIE